MPFNPDSNQANDIMDTLRVILADYVGTFQNGREAIWKEPPDAPAFGTGLHVYLKRTSEQYTQDLYQWCVTFIQYDKTEAGLLALDAAIEAMRYWFPINREIHLPFTSEGYPQFQFDIRFNKAAFPIFS